MKVEQLIQQLLPYKNFEVEAVFSEVDETKTGFGALNYNKFKVVDVADIGHSSKVVILDLQK